MGTQIVITGDIGFDKYMDKKWKDSELISESCLEFLCSADHVVINVEGPLLKKEKEETTGSKALIHSMDPEAADFFVKLGADIWNINNNHIMDAGEKGIKDTILIAKEKNVKTLGAGMNIKEAAEPLVINECGGIALIGTGYERACRIATFDTPGCLNFSRMDIIESAIKQAKANNRWCVVIAHDGEEFTSLPMPYTRDRYIKYLEFGADIVVAHHPHVPMNYELFDNNKAIFYSLGNFIFDTDYQRSQFNTEKGVLLKLIFTDSCFSFTPFGISIDRYAGRIVESEIPDIFTNVTKEEYEKLLPLAAKAFIENTKRQLRYLKPDKFVNATDEDFVENFYEPLRSGRVPGKILDMQIVYPLSLQADNEMWQKSKLDRVKEYILSQIREKD